MRCIDRVIIGLVALSFVEASFVFGRVGSLEAGERVRESARRRLGREKREETPRLSRLPVVPSAPCFSPIHLPHPLGASAEERG